MNNIPPNMQPPVQTGILLPSENVKVNIQSSKVVSVGKGENIVQAIDNELQLAGAGPNDVVECNGTVERENSEDLNSRRKIGTYYNEDLQKHCYCFTITWEIKIIKEDGKIEKINVQQERFSDFEVPPVNKLRLETDRAYKCFLLGNEYAKTISAVFDTNHPEHPQMQGATKNQLLQDDTLYITIEPNWLYRLFFACNQVSDDPSIIFKGYGSSKIKWGGSDGKKVTIMKRNFSKEVYEVDRASNRIFRTMNSSPSQNNYLSDGLDILLIERIKLDRKSNWFKKLIELEEISSSNLLEELEKNNIPLKDWADRICEKAKKYFENGMMFFGRGVYSQAQFHELAKQIDELKKEPAKNKEQIERLRKNYAKLPEQFAAIRNFADQLEILNANGVKITSNDDIVWSAQKMREKANYMENLYNALNSVL